MRMKVRRSMIHTYACRNPQKIMAPELFKARSHTMGGVSPLHSKKVVSFYRLHYLKYLSPNLAINGEMGLSLT